MYPNENKVGIDKLWIDQDSLNSHLLLRESKIIHERLLNIGFEENNMVIGFTGKKGFHDYAKLKVKKYNIEKTKQALHYILSYVCRDLISPDVPLFGDPNRMVRVSGIMRPEKTIMIMIDPQELFMYSTAIEYFKEYNYEWNRIVDKGTQYLRSIDGGANLDILDIENTIMDETGFVPSKKIIVSSPTPDYEPVYRNREYGMYSEYLKKILKNNDLYSAIHAPNPVHLTRLRFGLKMLRVGLDLEECLDIIKSLQWLDYDPAESLFQLNDLKRRYL